MEVGMALRGIPVLRVVPKYVALVLLVPNVLPLRVPVVPVPLVETLLRGRW